jgi:hypothetical protein
VRSHTLKARTICTLELFSSLKWWRRAGQQSVQELAPPSRRVNPPQRRAPVRPPPQHPCPPTRPHPAGQPPGLSCELGPAAPSPTRPLSLPPSLAREPPAVPATSPQRPRQRGASHQGVLFAEILARTAGRPGTGAGPVCLCRRLVRDDRRRVVGAVSSAGYSTLKSGARKGVSSPTPFCPRDGLDDSVSAPTSSITDCENQTDADLVS